MGWEPPVGVGDDGDSGWTPWGWLPRAALGAAQAIADRGAEAHDAFANQGIGAGIVSAASIPFDAAASAVQYPAGVAIGAMQAASPDAGNPIDVRERERQLAEAGRGSPLVGAPLAGVRAFGRVLDDPTQPRVLPPVGNIADPREAMQRFHAAAPPLLDIATGMAAGGLGLGLVGKALKGAALGAEAVEPTALGQTARTSRYAQAVQDFTQTPAAQRLGAVAKLAAPVGLAGEMVRETPATDADGNPTGPWTYLLHAGAGAITGAMLVGGGKTALAIARAGAVPNLSSVPAGTERTVAAVLGSRNAQESLRATERAPESLLWPGGGARWALDAARTEISDALAKLKTVSRFGIARIESGQARAEAATAAPAAAARVAPLVQEQAAARMGLEQAQGELGARAREYALAQDKARALAKALAQAAGQPVAPLKAVKAVQAFLAAHPDPQAAQSLGELADARRGMDEATRGVGGWQKRWTRAGYALRQARDEAERLTTASTARPPANTIALDPGRLGQLFSGLAGKQRGDVARIKQALAPSGIGTPLASGLRSGEDRLFDEWLLFRSLAQRALKGKTSAYADGAQPGGLGFVATAEQGRDLYGAYLAPDAGGRVRVTPEQEARFERTLTGLTGASNDLLREAVSVGAIDAQKAQQILDSSWQHIPTKDTATTFQRLDVPEGGLTGRGFVSTDPVAELERSSTEPFTTGVRDILDHQQRIRSVIEQQRIMNALVAQAAADPMGVGQLVRPYLQPGTAAAEQFADDIAVLERQQKLAAASVRQAEQAASADLHDPALTRAFDQARAHADDVTRQLQKTRTRRQAAIQQAEREAQASGHAVPQGMGLIPYRRGEETSFYMMRRELADLLAGLDAEQVPHVLGVMQKFVSAAWRSMATGYSVPFAVANVPRDLLTAMHNYRGNPYAFFIKHYIPAFADVFGYTLGSGYQEFLDQLSRAPLGRAADWAASKAARVDDVLGGLSTRRMYAAGGGHGTLGEAIEAAPMYGARGGTNLLNPMHLLRKMSTISELPARVAVFKAELARGELPAEAAYRARTITTDFSKAGHSLRMLNLMMPLLNARVQGSLMSWESFQKDPVGFAGRVTATTAIPYAASYAWNRSVWGDLLDQINPDVQDRNVPVIYGTYWDDQRQREMPLYFKVPLDEVSAGVVIPLRQMLDQQYHTQTHPLSPNPGQGRTAGRAVQDFLGGTQPEGIPLVGAQRTQRPTYGVTGGLNNWIANWIPTNPRPEELDPLGLLWSAISMNPLAGVGSQLWANYDRFRGRPIYDANARPYDIDYASAPRASLLSTAAAELLNEWGPLHGHVAPPQVDFAMRGLFPALMQPPVAYGLDDMLRWAGYTPPANLSKQDVGLPADAPDDAYYARLAEWARAHDNRPALQRLLPRLFGAGGGAQSVIAKAEAAGPDKALVQQQTLALRQAGDQWDQDVYQPRLKEIYAHRDWTSGKINDALVTLAQQRRAFRDGLITSGVYPKAITDPKALKAFYASLPGIPVGAGDAAGLFGLPDGVDLDGLTARYLTPPGVDPTLLTPQQYDQARQAEIRRMALELTQNYGRPVDPSMLKTALVAHQRGITLPSLPVPATFYDDWVNRYMAPNGPDGNPLDPANAGPGEYRAAQQLELVRIVRENDLVSMFAERGLINPQDPSKGSPERQAQDALLHTVINPRLTGAWPAFDPTLGPLAQSRDNAYDLAARLKDRTRFPPFVAPSGSPVGTPDDWHGWQQELDAASQVPKKRWNVRLRTLDALAHYADAAKVRALHTDPHFQDYDLWFGSGLQEFPETWKKIQSGEIPTYVNRGRYVDPDTTAKLNFLVDYYKALPSTDPARRRLTPAMRRVSRMVVKNRKSLLDLDILKPNAVQSLERELADMESESLQAS